MPVPFGHLCTRAGSFPQESEAESQEKCHHELWQLRPMAAPVTVLLTLLACACSESHPSSL